MAKFINFDVFIGRRGHFSEMKFVATLEILQTQLPWHIVDESFIEFIFTEESVAEFVYRHYPYLRRVKNWYVVKNKLVERDYNDYESKNRNPFRFSL